ncbi:IS6 family transposase [Solimicrobium silvestre]|uniref:Transposase n=1 Tax=Solimicrobium silvestre TaxID=2099400 RepID=A0A2S9H1M9_9BURK|nr:IS6 family transposase [Solimicrobium silvestre]PRC93894.1 Transposase [Solimicrobium silvestre]
MNPSKPLYFRHRFPSEIISHCVWLYFRFSLRYRDIEEMMAERGVVVTYETIRNWSKKFGGIYAKRMRSRSKKPNDQWHLDEVYLSINGKTHYLWRAVDQDGEVLDVLGQPRRNKRAAKKFFLKLLKRLQYVPRLIITDKLGSYAAAKAEIMPQIKHTQNKGANNRAENSHQPTRERERQMRRFKSPGHAQRFLATYGVIASFFRPGRHLLSAKNYREIMHRRFAEWSEIVDSGYIAQ